MANRAAILKQTFQNSVALPVEQVLSEVVLEKLLEEQGVKYRQPLYTPIVVLWGWVAQVLDADKSLSNAVNRVTAWLAAAGEAVPSSDTGAYSKARKRLPLAVLKALLPRTAVALSSQVKPEQQWCGRRVKAYDGTSVLMSDTLANQAAYPQHRNQKAGCGFPLAKVVVWFCGTTGAVLEVTIAAFNTSEGNSRDACMPALSQRMSWWLIRPMERMWICRWSVWPRLMRCFANIMPARVISAVARN